MKKLVLVLSMFVMALAFVACNNGYSVHFYEWKADASDATKGTFKEMSDVSPITGIKKDQSLKDASKTLPTVPEGCKWYAVSAKPSTTAATEPTAAPTDAEEFDADTKITKETYVCAYKAAPETIKAYFHNLKTDNTAAYDDGGTAKDVAKTATLSSIQPTSDPTTANTTVGDNKVFLGWFKSATAPTVSASGAGQDKTPTADTDVIGNTDAHYYALYGEGKDITVVVAGNLEGKTNATTWDTGKDTITITLTGAEFISSPLDLFDTDTKVVLSAAVDSTNKKVLKITGTLASGAAEGTNGAFADYTYATADSAKFKVLRGYKPLTTSFTIKAATTSGSEKGCVIITAGA